MARPCFHCLRRTFCDGVTSCAASRQPPATGCSAAPARPLVPPVHVPAMPNSKRRSQTIRSPLSVNVARTIFVCLSTLLGIAISFGFEAAAWKGVLLGGAFGLAVVGLDTLLKNFSIRGFSAATFGLLIGCFCAWLVTRMGFFELPWFQALEDAGTLRNLFELMLYATLGFLGITLALRSDRDDFSLVIPYVRFREDAREGYPVLLDTNVVIDGRVPHIARTGFLSGPFIVPRFVLDELKGLADSRDEIKSARGKRGLDALNSMQENDSFDVTIYDDRLTSELPVDTRLIQLARELGARLLTNDRTLAKVASLRHVPVLNLHDLALAMHPVLTPGDQVEIQLVKPGKEDHQAVGYLPDGGMLVVNGARTRIGDTVNVRISTVTQTAAGRLLFADCVDQPANPASGTNPKPAPATTARR